MAGLVNYPDSSEEDEHTAPPSKKRKTSTEDALPPLPTAFLDQYSSTVRTSTQDDPSLHGGRKRATPHVQGNWPTHVYLEWHPNAEEAKVLSDIIAATRKSEAKHSASNGKNKARDDGPTSPKKHNVHSLLENDLGVSLPLHISLSRPLVLKTEQRDAYFSRLQKAISASNVKAFDTQPKDLAWHGNENSTRWFLVLRLQRSVPNPMSQLLEACNKSSNEFEQPLLYAGKDRRGRLQAAKDVEDKFHISVAWSLREPVNAQDEGLPRSEFVSDNSNDLGIPYRLLGRLESLKIGFDEVKVRMGQDVYTIPLKARR